MKQQVNIPEKILAYYRELWEEASEKGISREVQERMLQRIKCRMQEAETENVKRRAFPLGRWMRYTAAVILCVTIGLATHLYTRHSYQGNPADTVKTRLVVSAEKGQRANVTLPDGTRVWLNSHSQITYPNDYGLEARFLTLTGEAYFEVAKDSTKRFVVTAGEMAVEAIGTSFNIKAYQEDAEVVTTLFSGSIRTTVGKEEVKLLPEQFVSFNRSSRKLTSGYPENILYASLWRNNELAFESVSLEKIAVLLDRMYNVEVVFTSDKVRKYRFTGVIKNNSLDNVIEIISLTAPITYESKGNIIKISEKKRIKPDKHSINH
jgi:ferric-dicitrate binding protein FerR (iron transport regulator)